jgi:hypothetical protein
LEGDKRTVQGGDDRESECVVDHLQQINTLQTASFVCQFAAVFGAASELSVRLEGTAEESSCDVSSFVG